MVRLRVISTALTLLASVTLSVAALPGTAHANCSGGAEVNGNLVIGSTTWATESPVAGTCNAKSYYQTWFRSNYPGWRASVHISNDGKWEHHYGAYDTDWIYLDFTDTNSHSLINICIDDGLGDWWCGWGTNNYTAGTAWSGSPNHTMTGF